MRSRTRILLVGGGAGFALLFTAGAAGADAITPPGACVGSGTWQEGGFSETTTDRSSSDTIEIPRSDTVEWAGNIGGHTADEESPEEREISGEIEIDLPLGTVTIDDWGGTTRKYGNSGTHEYDLPNVASGVTLRLHGEHRENGTLVCSGAINLQIEGSGFDNPLSFVGIGGMVLTGAGVVFAGRAR